MTDKDKIIKELKEALDSLDITNDYRLNLIEAIEYLQEEPVSVWHDANEKSNEPEDVVIINPSDNTGEVLTNCTGVYSGRIWSYTSDLLNLDNPCKIGKNLQEEPVSDDLDKAVVEYMGQFSGENYYNSPWVMDSTGMAMPKELARFGANWQKAKDEEIIETAIHHAYHNGRLEMKEQLMANAIDGRVLVNGMGNPILHLWDKGRHLVDKKVKVILIEEG